MSQENVKVVRAFLEPHDGEDAIPAIRQSLERLGHDPEPGAVLADWAEDPGYRYAHPEILWDATGAGAAGGAIRGPREMVAWWREWVEAWQSYTYRVSDYRDLGARVLTESEVEAVGPGDIAVTMRTWQLWEVREGKVAAMWVFLSEQDALAAVD